MTSRSVELLDRVSNMPMILDVAVPKSVSVSIHNTLGDLISGSSEFKKKTLDAGDRVIAWAAGIEASALPKDAKPGDVLFGKVDIGTKIEGNLFSVAYVIPSEVKQAPAATTFGSEEPPKDMNTQMKESIRDVEIQYLKKLKDEDRSQLLAKLEGEWPDHLPLLVARLELLSEKEEECNKSKTPVSPELAHGIVTAADEVLERINLKELAMWFGVKHDMTLKAQVNKNKEMTKFKEFASFALQWKCTGLRDVVLAVDAIPTNNESSATATRQEPSPLVAFDTSLAEYAQWLPEPPTNDGHYLLLWVWRQRRKGRFGTAMKAVNKFLNESKNISDTSYNKLLDAKKQLLVDLGWRVSRFLLCPIVFCEVWTPEP